MDARRLASYWLPLLLVLGWNGTGQSLAAENWAQSLFSERGHDFGPVPRGLIVRHNFLLVNQTGKPLTVLDVRASCGCTTGRALSTQVAAGASTVVEAQMDTRNFVGPKATTLTITVVSSDGSQGEARLAVRSNILSDIVLDPGAVNFGAVARGQTGSQSVAIERLGAPHWKIVRMVAGQQLGRHITAQLDEVRRDSQGVAYRLTVNLRPDAPAGLVREEIRLATNDPETPIVPVLVTAEVRGGLSATPALVNLGHATRSGPPVQARILVRGNRPFQIQAIEGAGRGLTAVAADSESKTMHIINVSFQASQADILGDLRHTIRIVTNLADETPVDVPVIVQAAP